MKISERSLRISAASLLALFMVGAAYLLSGPTIFTSHTANAATTEALLKAYATKDSDGDGLPDWEEALYGTDPNKAISNKFGIPDGEAAKEGLLTPNALASQLPGADQGTTTLSDADFGGTPAPAPGSLTDQFSQEFLQQFVEASNGQPMDQDTENQLIQNLLDQFTQQSAATFTSSYSAVDVHTSNTATLQTYSAGVEQAFIDNDVSYDGAPLDIMMNLIVNNDPTAKKQLLSISAAYQAMADQLKQVPVPPAQSANHVALVESLEILAKTTNTAANYQQDPMATMGAFSAYSTASGSFGQALSSMATSILANGEPGDGDPGALIVALARISSS